MANSLQPVLFSILPTHHITMDNSVINFPVKLKDPSLFDGRGLLNGQWRHASLQKQFPVYEPSSGQVLGFCADLSVAEFREAIESAHHGYKQYYSSTTAKERGSLLRRWNELILESVEDCEFKHAPSVLSR